MYNKTIIISPTFPGYSSGYEIAVLYSLLIFNKKYRDIHFLSVSHSKLNANIKCIFPDVKWHYVEIKKSSKLKRFLLSIISKFPAVSYQYYSKSNKIIGEIKKIQKLGNKFNHIIIEDIPLFSLYDKIKKNNLTDNIILRSHNVLYDAFFNFSITGNYFKRLLWKYEIKRIEKLEKNAIILSQYSYAISQSDNKRYKQIYGKQCDDILSVKLVNNKFFDVNNGVIQNILYLGTLDLRKQDGIVRFINNVWCKVIEKRTNLNLYLGGRNSEKFNNPEKNIWGLGFINDDISFLNKGQIFINPQVKGSGIKLKSLIAMQSGKTLVTTSKGIEGIEGINGKHFIIANTYEEMYKIILNLLNNENKAFRIGNNARELVKNNYFINIHETNTTIC